MEQFEKKQDKGKKGTNRVKQLNQKKIRLKEMQKNKGK